MTSPHASAAYARLPTKIPPTVIRTERENEYYIGARYELEHRKALSREESELADLLTLLIEDFEERHYSLPEALPLEMLRFLMDQNHLKQKDLVDLFGARSIVSEVLSGKRELNQEHIRKLSERFGVSPVVFF
jgi:HTH-type transcriptional regulator/antitoxin HigA